MFPMGCLMIANPQIKEATGIFIPLSMRTVVDWKTMS